MREVLGMNQGYHRSSFLRGHLNYELWTILCLLPTVGLFSSILPNSFYCLPAWTNSLGQRKKTLFLQKYPFLNNHRKFWITKKVFRKMSLGEDTEWKTNLSIKAPNQSLNTSFVHQFTPWNYKDSEFQRTKSSDANVLKEKVFKKYFNHWFWNKTSCHLL